MEGPGYIEKVVKGGFSFLAIPSLPNLPIGSVILWRYFTQCRKVNFLIERLVLPPSISFFHKEFEYLESLQNKDQIQKYFQSEVQFQWILYIFCPIDYGVGNSSPWGATLAKRVRVFSLSLCKIKIKFKITFNQKFSFCIYLAR